MESFYATPAFRGAPTTQGMSTLESDDASDFSHPSLSGRYDSGICSLTDCTSFRSGFSSFGGPSKILDGTASLEEQMKRLGFGENGASRALGVNCTQVSTLESDDATEFSHQNLSVYSSDYYPRAEAREQTVKVEETTPMVEVDQTFLWSHVDPISTSVDLFQQDEDGDT